MHPYKAAPATAFWSRSVATAFEPSALIAGPTPLIRPADRVASAGSCFAANLVPHLERRGYHYLRTEPRHPAFAGVPRENLGYDAFSAAYGNVYTVRQLLQMLRRSVGTFAPLEDRWQTEAGVIDPYRPGLRYHALSDAEFDLLTAQHLRAVRRMFAEADVFIFTLGLTEAWVAAADGAVFPACPGTVTGTFDASRHVFHNFTAAEVGADLDAFVHELRALNPRVRLIVTVSPVPLVATATGQHVLCASTYSKAVLRVAAEEACRRHRDVTYFPAYELVTGPQARGAYLEPDLRGVTAAGVQAVMDVFLSHCEPLPGAARAEHREPALASQAWLSQRIADAECEEAMADRRQPPGTGFAPGNAAA
jgi:hypothetical protein